MTEQHILHPQAGMFHVTPIPITPQYGITRDGMVWNLKRNWHIKGSVNAAGYRTVALVGPNGQRTHTVHRLLYWTFIGPIRPRQKIRHINGDKTDDRVENLILAGPKPRTSRSRPWYARGATE